MVAIRMVGTMQEYRRRREILKNMLDCPNIWHKPNKKLVESLVVVVVNILFQIKKNALMTGHCTAWIPCFLKMARARASGLLTEKSGRCRRYGG